jgi:hypothetical protein
MKTPCLIRLLPILPSNLIWTSLTSQKMVMRSTFIGSYVKLSSAVGGHLGRRTEPPDTFLEENHPMTISSKFSSNIEQMVSDKKIF